MVEAVLSGVVVLQAIVIVALVWMVLQPRVPKAAMPRLGLPVRLPAEESLAACPGVQGAIAKKPARIAPNGWTGLKEKLERGERPGESEGAVTK